MTLIFPPALKYVLDRFRMDKFKGTQQEAIHNFLKGKDVLQPTGSEKSVLGKLSQIPYRDEETSKKESKPVSNKSRFVFLRLFSDAFAG